MRRLFFGIYSGMLCCILIVGGLSYFFLGSLNDYRYQQHLEDNLKGTLFLLNRGLSRQSDEHRERWLTLVSRIIGAPITLKKNDYALQPGESELHYRGGRAYQYRSALMSDPGLAIEVPVQYLNEGLMTATAFLILNELGRYPSAERQTLFDTLREHMPYPVIRSSQTKKTMNKKQLARISRGEVVIEWGKQFDRSHSMSVYAPWGNSDDLLVMGPIVMFDPYPIEILVAVFVLALGLITLILFLLIRNLSKRLQIVQYTVDEITPDYLGEAPSYQADDAIGLLNYKIHQMMVRIRKLLDEQTYMIQAVSHDLRTPMAKIHFRLEMLSEDLGEQHPMLLACKRDLKQLNHLIDELLTYEKTRQFKNAEATQVNISKLTKQTRDDFETLYPNIEFTLHMPTDPLYVQGNKVLLKRLLENLLQNAGRHARGRAAIMVSRREEDVYWQLDDDGPGIDPAVLSDLFKPFFQADKSRDPQYQGYGLGLAIAQQIVHHHSGKIQAENSGGGGARFSFSIPLFSENPDT
ncbi:MAG: ATP-binding protein [Pseudomonadales bacterium]|nr:ATP-binding protein [Pseudomonadales bacterium]